MKKYLFPLFLPLAGVWTIKMGSLSLAGLAFVILGLPNFGINKKLLPFYLMMCVGAISFAINYEQSYSDAIYYSIYFPVISIFFIYVWTRWVENIKLFLSENLIEKSCWISILLALTMVLINSPLALISPIDGPNGLFNEKGILGQYLAITSSLLLSVNRSQLVRFVFLIILIYNIAILESGRAIFFYTSVFLIYYQVNHNKVSIKLISIIFFFLGLIFITFGYDFLIAQLDKIEMALYSDRDLIGRYAASFLLRESSPTELLYGHGFGSYLSYRAESLPLFGMEFDYPGSVLIELLFEVGIFITIIVLLILSRLVFNSHSFIYLTVIILLLSFGVKHDITTFTSLLVAQIINIMEKRRSKSAVSTLF